MNQGLHLKNLRVIDFIIHYILWYYYDTCFFFFFIIFPYFYCWPSNFSLDPRVFFSTWPSWRPYLFLSLNCHLYPDNSLIYASSLFSELQIPTIRACWHLRSDISRTSQIWVFTSGNLDFVFLPTSSHYFSSNLSSVC